MDLPNEILEMLFAHLLRELERVSALIEVGGFQLTAPRKAAFPLLRVHFRFRQLLDPILFLYVRHIERIATEHQVLYDRLKMHWQGKGIAMIPGEAGRRQAGPHFQIRQ